MKRNVCGKPTAVDLESGDHVHDLPERRSPKVMALIRRIPKDGGSRTDLTEEFQLDCHKFNPSKGRFLHPEEDRAITMREAALLQGFPRRCKFPTTNNKAAVALMIGNTLPPPFIAAHARSILRVLR